MKVDAPKNLNYSAQIVRIPALIDLKGLDNLVGIPVLGGTALVSKGEWAVGDLGIAFTAETALSEDFARHNNLYRHAEQNVDPTVGGYIEDNRRIRAIKLRGHQSNVLLMPLSSVNFTGFNGPQLVEGEAFDRLSDQEICSKYELPVKPVTGQQKRIEKLWRRVDAKHLPEHTSTESYWRSKHLLHEDREVVVTAKLHGTSWRGGRVPVLRKHTWLERVAKKLGIRVDDYELDFIAGSRKVIKDPALAQDHYYKIDVWSEYGKRVADLIPDGVILYGELIGWLPGTETPIQANYTYNLPVGECELYAYRVATVNTQGTLTDLSWDGVREFCQARGIKTVPELRRLPVSELDGFLDEFLDQRLADFGDWNEPPLIVSSHKTVDEGVVFRQEGIIPRFVKAKSPEFLRHETAEIDKGQIDLESAA